MPAPNLAILALGRKRPGAEPEGESESGFQSAFDEYADAMGLPDEGRADAADALRSMIRMASMDMEKD